MSARLIKGASGAYAAPAYARAPAVGADAPQRAAADAQSFIPRPAAELLSTPPPATRTPGAPRPAPAAVESADAEAGPERIVAEARARAGEIERQARERGLAEARARADEEVARAADPLRQRLAQTVEEIAALRGQIVARAERDLVKLALEIAKRIVHREVTVDGDVALTLARVALGRIHSRAQVKLRLHPEDFAFVNARLEELPGGCSVELVEDRAVGRGGCLVETEMGDLDARIERQFAEVERSLLSL